MSRCPNKSHPDWQKLVNKVGESKAYLEYMKNNQEIPNPDHILYDAPSNHQTYKWARYDANGYEVSSQGDKRFSALIAKLKDGRTIEEAYQLDIKGYRQQGNDWHLGKGKPPLRAGTREQHYNEYKNLWKQYLAENPEYLKDLKEKARGKVLTDKFASTPVSQARALAELLNEESQQSLFETPNTEKSDLLLDGFESFYQQNEAVNIMGSSIISFFRANPEIKAARWKKAVDSFKASLNAAKEATPNEAYDVVLKNLPALEEITRKKLQVLGLIRKDKLEGISFDTYKGWLAEEDELDSMEEIDAINSWKDEWTFQFDSKDNALQRVKSFLAFIPRSGYDKQAKEFYEIESFIPNEPSFMSYDEVYEQLKGILAGVENTWEAMEAELLKYQEAKPFIQNILNYQLPNYQGDREQLKRQFVSTMSASYGGFKTILVKEINGNYFFNVIDTDQSSIEKTILNGWTGEYKRTDLFEEDEKGNLVPNKEKVKQYIDKIKKAEANPTISNVNSLLKDIGINVSETSVEQIVNSSFNKKSIKLQFTDKDGLFKLIENRLRGERSADKFDQTDEAEEALDFNNPIVNNSAITALARLESKTSDNYYSNTFKDGEGNTIYSYTFNKFLTKEFIKLQNNPEYVKQLLDITFNKPIYKDNEVIYKSWLFELDTNPTFKSIFNISPFDTVKLMAPGRDGVKLTSMSDLDIELTQLALIQNSGASKKGLGRIIKYLLTVPSKTTSYIIQGTGQDVKLQFDAQGRYRLDPQTKDALYSIVASEYNRILSQQARKASNKAYDKGSSYFYFFPELNNDQTIYSDGNLKLPTTVLADGKTVEQYLRSKVLDIVHKSVLAKIKTWTELGIIQNNEIKLVDLNYKNSIVNPQVKENKANEITFTAADYVINSMLAKFNTHQTFIDDPAIYYKKSVKDTWDNVNKRLTNLIAPFKDGMIDETNKNFLSIKLEDIAVNAMNYAQLERRLKQYYEDNNIQLPYKDIDGTDAQEYTTLREDIKVKYMYGVIDTKTYDDLIARINKEKDDLVLSPSELSLLFTAVKPVYSSRIVDKAEDVVYREYIKSSSIPLLPQFTKGLELDKLRKAMEKTERTKKLSVRAVFDSGTKLGGKQSLNIWNEDGTIKEDIDLDNYGVVLERSNFGIQQEVPYDENKDEIVKSTQETKLLFDALQETTGFRYDGKQINGKDLYKIYSDLHKEIYEKGLAKLEAKVVRDGRLDIVALSAILTEEGINRGYSPAQLSFLKLNEDKIDFEVPFWSHISNDKEQALVTSLYTNNILKQKMPGSSNVLVSEEGVRGMSLDTVYSSEYDPTTGLKPMRIVYKKGAEMLEEEAWLKLGKADREGYTERVKPAQILLPFNIRDKKGKLLNRKDFITEDGKIDTKKLPREILTSFGFRIPNQGHNSMSLVEIVGFLPESYVGIVIASRNFITQMGSDFDVDKLYIYSYYLDVDKDKQVSKLDDPKNKLLDIHKSVLYNPKVFDAVVKPLDLGKLKYKTLDNKTRGIAEELRILNDQKIENYLDPDYAKTKYLQSIDGKAMVGINAVGNTFLSIIQGKKMYLQTKEVGPDGKIKYVKDYIVFSDAEGKQITLSDLSSPFSLSGRRKNEVKSAYLSAAVDNEKDPILSTINHNPQTASVETLLIALGMEEELSLFSAQPIIVEYANKVKLSRSTVSQENKREEDIIKELLIKYAAGFDSLLKKFPLGGIADLAIGPLHFRQVLHNTAPVKVLNIPELTTEEIQAAVLFKFAKIKEYGDVFSRAQGLFNVDSKGVGKSFLELSDKREKIDKALANRSIKRIHKVAGDLEKGGVLVPNTNTGYAIVNGMYAADDTISKSKLMPFSTQNFTDITEEFAEVTGRDITADQKYEIWKAIKSYIYADNYSVDERERLFFDRDNNKSLNTRISDLLKTKLSNNPFLLRLDLSKVSVDGKLPSYIFYNASKEEDIEELNVYQGLLDLVYSKDAEVKSIGEDLIKYFYINGGNQAAKEWGRYINPKMLQEIGLSDFIKDVKFYDPEVIGLNMYHNESDPSLSPVLLQLFQHKPYLAPRLNHAGTLKYDNTGKALLKNEADNIPLELKRGTSVTPIFTVKEGATTKIYYIVGRNSNGAYIYQQIPRLGTKFFNEYQRTSLIPSTLLAKKFKINTKDATAYRERIKPSDAETQTIVNPVISAEIKELLNKSLADSLDEIDSTNYHKYLRDIFSQLKNIIGDIKVESSDEEGFAGRWNPATQTITVATTALGKQKQLTRKNVEGIILKETIHVINHKLFSKEFKATPEQEQARKAIEDLYTNLRELVLAGELSNIGWDKDIFIRYDSLIKQKREGKTPLTEADNKFLGQNKRQYYGLTHVEDFMHEALLEPTFREALNQVKYSSNKSLLERLGEIIQKILEGFEGLVNIKKGSALEEAFGQIFKLTQPANNTKTGDAATDLEVQHDLEAEELAATEDKAYTKIVNDFEIRLTSISKDISKARAEGNKELANTLVNRYEEVKEEKDNLISENTFETVLKLANNDLKYVENLLKQETIKLNDLLYSEIVLGTWTKIDNSTIYPVLTSFDVTQQTKRFDDVTDIAAKARKLHTTLSAMEVGRFVELAREATDKPIEETDITKVQDIGFLQSYTRDISTSDNIVLSVTDKWIRDKDFEAVTDLNKVIEELETVARKIENTVEFKEKGFAGIFGQETKDGELTGEIVDALKHEYYSTKQELLDAMDEANNPISRKQAAENYYKWVRDNHIIVETSKLYRENSDGVFEYAPDANYLKALKTHLKEDFDKTVAKAKALTEEYNEELKLQIEYYKGAEDGFRKLEAWKVANSPLIYIDNLKNGLTSRKVGGEYIKNTGWKYISKRVIGSWEDDKYNEIQKNKDLKEYYDFYRTTLKNLYDFLPYNIRRDLKPTEIPNINRTLVEELTNAGIGKSWNRLWSAFLENISVTNSEPTRVISPITGGFQKDFKFDYLSKIDPDKKSYDLTRVLKLFANQAIGYKYKSQVEDQVRLAESILRQAVEKQIKSNGDVATDKFGSITTIKGLKNLYNQFDYAFDSFYGHKKDQREGVTNRRLITPKDRESLDEDIAEIKDKKLPEEQEAAMITAATEKYTRKISGGRLGDTLLQWIQLKGMGWNVFAGVNNMVFGQMANFNWAAGNVDFSDTDMMKAVGTMLSFDSTTEKKVRALMIKFNTVKQLRETVHKSTSNFNKARVGMQKLAPYELYAKGEYFVQGQVLVAMLNHQQVEVTEAGVKKTIPLYEALDESGNWDEKRFGENPEYSNTSEKTKEIKNKLDTLLKKIHGNYDPNAAMLSNKKFIGRAVMQFRRWIPEGVAQRFDSEKYDIHLQRNTQGRYITYYDLGLVSSAKTLLKQVFLKDDKAFADLTTDPKKLEIIKENMKKNLREIYYKLSMVAMYFVLSGLDDDDDEWAMGTKNYVLNTILRLQDDIEFYYSPIAFENITRAALPVTSVIVDAAKFLDAIQDTVSGEGTYQSGTHSGDSKLMWRGARMIPGGSAITGFINKTEAQEAFRK